MAAASADDVATVESLLQAGARPQATDRHGRTALWIAASLSAHRAVVALAPRSTVDAADEQGVTALMAAAGRGHLPTVNALLAAGADARKVSRNGNGALHAACAAGHAALVPRLLAAHASLDAMNAGGDTSLHLAVRARCRACVSRLVEAGASRSLRNADGLTAPDIARLAGDKPLLALLE
jgi:hypothetical protein